MQIVLNFVLKHKKVFIVLGVLWLAYTVWSYYRALQQAKAAGRGFGEGVKGTASGVAGVLVAPFAAVAGFLGEFTDLVIGNGAQNPALADTGYTFSAPQSQFEQNLWGGQAPSTRNDPSVESSPMFNP